MDLIHPLKTALFSLCAIPTDELRSWQTNEEDQTEMLDSLFP